MDRLGVIFMETRTCSRHSPRRKSYWRTSVGDASGVIVEVQWRRQRAVSCQIHTVDRGLDGTE